MTIASSPLVPFVTTGLLAALIVGTSYGSNSEERTKKEDEKKRQADAAAAEAATAAEGATDAAAPATDAAAPAADAASAALPAAAKCAAGSCTVTFPKTGGQVTVFGKPMVMKKAFASGLSYTYAGKPGSASTAKPGVAGTYKVTVTKVEAGGFTMTVGK